MADRKPKKSLTVLISIFSLIIVGISLTPVLFPGLITANVGFQEYPNQFEFGSNSVLLLVGNLTMITFGVLFYKKKLPNLIQTPATKFLKKKHIKQNNSNFTTSHLNSIYWFYNTRIISR